MHLYRYKCDNCDNSFTKLQDKPLDTVDCNKCGKPARRVISGFSTRYKGEGFYNTDYKEGD